MWGRGMAAQSRGTNGCDFMTCLPQRSSPERRWIVFLSELRTLPTCPAEVLTKAETLAKGAHGAPNGLLGA
jgi:hypothetical protein